MGDWYDIFAFGAVHLLRRSGSRSHESSDMGVCTGRWLAWLWLDQEGIVRHVVHERVLLTCSQQVDKRTHLPLNSILLSAVISMLLGLINIGSSVAFNAIVSLVVAAYFGSYMIPLAIVIYKRIRKEPLEMGPWNMGRWGLAVNLFAMVCTVYCSKRSSHICHFLARNTMSVVEKHGHQH